MHHLVLERYNIIHKIIDIKRISLDYMLHELIINIQILFYNLWHNHLTNKYII